MMRYRSDAAHRNSFTIISHFSQNAHHTKNTMNKIESEGVTDMSGGNRKKRKKYVFLDKFEDHKRRTESNIRALYILCILQTLALITGLLFK